MTIKTRLELILFLLVVFPNAFAVIAMGDYAIDQGTPLMIAAQRGDMGKVKTLVTTGVNINEANDNSATPLIFAASAGKLEVVEYLLAKGANPNQCAYENVCPLWYAVRAGSMPVVKRLLQAGAKIDSNPDFNAFESPILSVAAANGSLDLVKLLLDKGVKVDSSEPVFHNTALAEAVANGQTGIAKLLIQKGADLGEVSETQYYQTGKTALEVAQSDGYAKTVQLIREALKNPAYKQPKYTYMGLLKQLYLHPKFDLEKQGGKLSYFLSRRSMDKLRKLRNAIFARKDYAFRDQKLRRFFATTFPTYKPEKRNVTVTNIDKCNIRIIRAAEKVAYNRSIAG